MTVDFQKASAEPWPTENGPLTPEPGCSRAEMMSYAIAKKRHEYKAELLKSIEAALYSAVAGGQMEAHVQPSRVICLDVDIVASIMYKYKNDGFKIQYYNALFRFEFPVAKSTPHPPAAVSVNKER